MGLLCEYDQEVCIACRGKRSKANKGKQQSAHELLTTLEESESISGRKRFQETSGGFSEPEEDFKTYTGTRCVDGNSPSKTKIFFLEHFG